MTHQYSRKFKNNRNMPYVLVNGRRLFTSLFAAEEYCMAQGLDVEVHIEYDISPEFKAKTIEIAKNQLAVLSMAMEALDSRYETLKAEHLTALAEARHAAETRDLLKEHYERRASEVCAKLGECHECRHTLFNMREELFKITGWRE